MSGVSRHGSADADTNAQLLAEALGVTVDNRSRVRFTYLPLLLGEHRWELINAIAPHLLGLPATDGARLDFTLFGLHVVNSDHPVMSLPSAPPSVENVLEQMKSDIWPNAPTAVLEIGNHYFIGEVPDRLRPHVQQVTDELNNYAVSARRDILARTRERLVIVRGTDGAAGAALTMLRREEDVIPTTVVTEEAVARDLLDLLRNPSVRTDL